MKKWECLAVEELDISMTMGGTGSSYKEDQDGNYVCTLNLHGQPDGYSQWVADHWSSFKSGSTPIEVPRS